MDASFCVAALQKAMACYGKPNIFNKPDIFNTNRDGQFTSSDFTDRIRDTKVIISMDGRERCMDNIFVEHLWRSLRYETVYLREPADGFHAERMVGEWIGFYNAERPHSALRRSDAVKSVWRLTYIPTDSTAAGKSDKQVLGGMIRQRITP